MDATRVDARLSEAMAHVQAGRAAQAAAVLQGLLAEDPHQPEACHLLGVLLLQSGNGPGAEPWILRALEGRPTEPLFHLNLGLVRAGLGRLAEALPCFRQAVALAPDAADPLRNLAVCLQHLGREAEAIPVLQRLAALGAADPELLRGLGLRLTQASRWDEAAMAWGQLLAALPGDPEALSLGALARLESGQPEEAATWLLQALASDESPRARRIFLHLLRKGWGATPAGSLAPWVVQALETPWCRPSDLWAPALALLNQLVPGATEGDDLASLAGQPLLEALLGTLPMADLAWEHRLIRARAHLVRASEAPLAPEPLALACALARQAFLNEYVWDLEPDLADRATQGARRLETGLAQGLPIPEALVAAVACCRPLHTLEGAGALLARPWSDPVAALLSQQVAEPLREAALRADLPLLTPLGTGVSAEVRAQYEANPYPRWTRTALEAPAATFDAFLEGEGVTGLAPVAPGGGARILVAGCGTGREALEIACSCQGAEVLAVDLSRTSLAYGERMAQAAGIRNVTFAQADLLQLEGLPRTFDVIVCFGVLHHLADPLAGWRVLRDRLAPGGVMRIGLYSERGRAEVVAARELIARRNLPPTPEGIRTLRALLQTPAEALRFSGLLRSHDFFTLSTCRDLLFHVQEHRFTLPRLKACLADLGLDFCGFQLPPEIHAAYRARFPHDPTGRDLDSWDRFEAEHPTLFSAMYQFWVQRP